MTAIPAIHIPAGFGWTQPLLAIGVVAAFSLSLAIGPAALGPAAMLAGLFGGTDETATIIMREIRLPRAGLGLLIGATLGLSGAGLQGLFRNPLAEPGIIGASSLAAVGAVLALYFGLYAAFTLALPLCGIAGALVAVLLLHLIAGRDSDVLVLILAGVAISSLGGALVALAVNLSSSPYAVSEIVFWLMGSLADRSLAHLWLAMPFILVGWILIASTARALDALSLDDATAESLGFALTGVRLRLIVGTALAVGASVSVSGSIGFVGLVVPHLLRPLVGHRPSRLLPASALGGALLLLLADTAVRLMPTTTELRLGVLTALIGVPFFLMLVLKSRRGTP
jgi:iron complex transport system permease protein